MRWVAWTVLGMLGCASVAPNVSRPVDARFDVVVLGGSGGIDESDLTSVLLSRAGRGEFIALDVGTLYAGLVRAAAKGTLAVAPGSKWTAAGEVLKHHLHGCFVSHAHFDHIAGLIITSPEATKQTVYGLAPTLDALRVHAFSGALWDNFTDEGPGAIGRYHLAAMTPGAPVTVAPAALRVEAFPLSHGALSSSTAFLVEADDAAALYLGDTAPDAVAREGRLAALWQRVAPLVSAGRLRVLFIEASFPDPRDEKLLFGHLTPAWLMRELDALAAAVNPASPARALEGLNVVITHVKPSLQVGVNTRDDVRRQLAPLEARGVRVVMPDPGQRSSF